MERRKSLRLEKSLPVKFDLVPNCKLSQQKIWNGAGLPASAASGGSFEALSRNISEGGLFIETDLVQNEAFALGKDRLMDLEFELLGRARGIKPKARIVWVNRKARATRNIKSGFGIKFIRISPEEKKEISLFISRETFWQAGSVPNSKLSQQRIWNGAGAKEKEVPPVSGEHRLTDRNRRNLEILEAVRKNRLISRAEISKNTGINIVTVSNYIDTYLKKGLIFERGLDISTGGRRPELIEINPQYGYVIGVDLGPLNVGPALMRVAAADFGSRILARAEEKRQNDDIEEALPVLKDLIAKVAQSEAVRKEKIKGIGVGIYGIMDKFAGTVRNPVTEDTFANYIALKKELEDTFGLPVFIENSATCALFGEKWTGVDLEAKAADNIIYIVSDSQCAIMLNGEIYTGSSKSAGQLNFASPPAPLENSSLTGRNNSSHSDYCWMNPVRPQIDSNEAGTFSDCVLRSKAGDLAKMKSKEDITALGLSVGAKIAHLVNIFNPQVVIVGSDFCRLGDVFLDTIRRSVSRWAFRENSQQVRIVPATLAEDAVTLGAASLVIEAALANI